MNGRRDEPSSGVKGRKLVEGTPVVASERAPPRNGGPSDALTPAALNERICAKYVAPTGSVRPLSAVCANHGALRGAPPSAPKKGLARACRSAPWASELSRLANDPKMICVRAVYARMAELE